MEKTGEKLGKVGGGRSAHVQGGPEGRQEWGRVCGVEHPRCYVISGRLCKGAGEAWSPHLPPCHRQSPARSSGSQGTAMGGGAWVSPAPCKERSARRLSDWGSQPSLLGIPQAAP